MSKSVTFVFCLVFLALIFLSSSVIPYFSLDWALAIGSYVLSISIFILITARLANKLDNFFIVFFTFLSIISSINACINIYLHYQSYWHSEDFFLIRLVPNFGLVPDHWPTTGALAYGVVFVSSVGLLLMDVDILIRLAITFSLIIHCIILYLIQTRGVAIGVVVSIAIIFMFKFDFKKIFFFALFFFLLLVGVLQFIDINMLFRRGYSNRLEIWEHFIRLAKDRIILGFGERIEFRLIISNGEIIGHGHNIFISALARGGLGAVFFLFAAYVSATAKSFLFALTKQNSIPLALVIFVFISGLFDYDQIAFLPDWQWVCFWLPIGLAVASESYINFE